jgi:hypothetical protein
MSIRIAAAALFAVAAFALFNARAQKVPAAPAGCSTERFTVLEKSTRVDGSRIFIAGTVRNDNPVGCNVKMQVSVLDRTGKIVDTERRAYENVAAGATRNFSIRLRGGLSKAGAGATYMVEPIESRTLTRGPR